MKWLRLAAIAAFLMVASDVVGQIGAPCPDREVIVNVINKDATRVSGLTVEDFEFKPDIVSGISATRFYSTPRVMILLDTSGSMRAPKTQAASHAAIDLLLANLPTQSPIALTTFSIASTLGIPFTTDRKLLGSELDAMYTNPATWAGGTELFPALIASAKLFAENQRGDAIFLVSDSEGSGGTEARIREVTRELLSRGIRLFTVLVTTQRQFSEWQGLTYSDLSMVARATGGIAAWGLQPGDDLKSKVAAMHWLSSELGARVFSGYLLKLRLEQPLHKWRKWSVRIKAGPNGKHKGLRVEYPAELAPCPVASTLAPN